MPTRARPAGRVATPRPSSGSRLPGCPDPAPRVQAMSGAVLRVRASAAAPMPAGLCSLGVLETGPTGQAAQPQQSTSRDRSNGMLIPRVAVARQVGMKEEGNSARKKPDFLNPSERKIPFPGVRLDVGSPISPSREETNMFKVNPEVGPA